MICLKKWLRLGIHRGILLQRQVIRRKGVWLLDWSWLRQILRKVVLRRWGILLRSSLTTIPIALEWRVVGHALDERTTHSWKRHLGLLVLVLWWTPVHVWR
jgi:hypothetical protein